MGVITTTLSFVKQAAVLYTVCLCCLSIKRTKTGVYVESEGRYSLQLACDLFRLYVKYPSNSY